jgi:hypothetical protein
VFEIFYRNVKGMPFCIEVFDDRFEFPVAVLIHHISVIAIAQQFRIQTRIIGHRALPGTYTGTHTGANPWFFCRLVIRSVVVDQN